MRNLFSAPTRAESCSLTGILAQKIVYACTESSRMAEEGSLC